MVGQQLMIRDTTSALCSTKSHVTRFDYNLGAHIPWVQNLPHDRRKWRLIDMHRSARGISENNRRLLADLYRGVQGPFTVQEAATALSFSIPRTQRFLAYLADRGWLVRIRRGLYAAISLDAAEPGEWRADPWVVAAKLYGPSFYIGGWTACEHWALTEQIFRETVVFTTRRVRRRDVEIQGFPFRVKRAASGKFFGTKTVWRSQSRIQVSDPSRTVADILDDPALGGGIRHVAEVLETYLGGEHRNDALIVEYIGRIGNRSAYKRLGYLLEALAVTSPALLKACRDGVSAGVSLLDPAMPARGHILRRWNLRINTAVADQRAAG